MNMDVSPLAETLQILSYLASIIGFPVAILVFWNEKQKENKAREYRTYDSIDEKYFTYLQLCIENPELDLYYLPLEKEVPLSPEQKIKQVALFEILASMMERAYLLYSDQSTHIKKSQWEGWDSYIQIWSKRDIFRRLWKLVGKDFDEDFYTYMDHVLKTTDSHSTI
jgi:hypothetical protein